MSSTVRVTARHNSIDVDEAFEMVCNFQNHALLSDAVRNVRVEQEPDGTMISHWEVNFRKGVLVWSEFDHPDPATRTLRFRRRDGDPEHFAGTWSVREHPAGSGSEVTYEAEFDIGIPTMRKMLEPIAARTLRENIVQTFRGLLGDTVEIDANGAAPAKRRRSASEEEERDGAMSGAEVVAAAPSLGAAFERLARLYGDATAVADESTELSYATLDRRANSVCAALLSRGVQPGQRVGLCVERSVEAAVAIIGILKAGAAYVPLDPAYPAERLAFITEDAGISTVVGDPEVASTLGLGEVELVTTAGPLLAATRPAVARSHAAYVIYTSGSTGAPKGCVITHGNVLSLMEGTSTLFDFGSSDRWSLFHSFNFDVSVWELWRAFVDGGCAVIASEAVVKNPSAFATFLVDNRITILSQVPSVFRYTVLAWERAGCPPLAVRTVIFAGEAIDLATISRFAAASGEQCPQFINMYGITEITVHATYKRLEPSDWETPTGSPIGTALPHLEIVVLDESGDPVREGEIGEMWVAGGGVAEGYLNRPELTAERFKTLSIGGGERRFYRSGDLARLRPDGELDFAGRNDQQVKVNGFRIEPGEIEAVLLSHGGVEDAAVVVASTPSGSTLVGVVTDSGAPDGDLAAELRRYCQQRLPRHMVPSRIKVVDELPLMPSGKLDRRTLTAQFNRAPDAERA